MYIVTLTSLFATFLVLLETERKISFGFGLAFFLVTFLQAVHYDYGSDYMAYMKLFNEFTEGPFSFKYFFASLNYRDPFWPIFCYMFKPFGFFGLVAFLSIFQNSVYFYFIRKFVPESWLALGVFVYLFTPQLYMLNMSMFRQGFTEAIFLTSFLLVQEKKLYRYIIATILMVCAGQIHSSANLFLPFLLWPLIPMKNAKEIVLLFLILFVVFYTSTSLTNYFATIFFKMSFFERFTFYSESKANILSVWSILMTIPAFVILLFLKDNQNEMQNRIVSMAVFERIIVPFSTMAALAGRLGIYFSVFYMVAIPIAYSKVRDYYTKMMLTVVYLATSLYNYFVYFGNPLYASSYQNFHSIFEVIF